MTRPEPLAVGDPVELHTRFSDSWVGGFEIATVLPDGYRVRRLSDGTLLPDPSSARDLRPVQADDPRRVGPLRRSGTRR